MISKIKDKRFIEDIIDGMYDWVRVLDRQDNIIFMNKAMSEAFSRDLIGEKCYRLTGKNAPCENCISRQTVFDGHSHEKEEIIDGKIFSVMSSPVRDEKGDIIGVVEVLRDVTQVKKLQNKILQQNRKLQDDLSIAQKLQCSLLPKPIPEDKINFSFVYKPCEAIGGDFVDFFKIDEDNIGIYIADVSGHGVSASILTVFLRSAINKKTLSPSKALEDLFYEFNRNGFDPQLYITVFYAIINTKDYTLTYANAGHNVIPIIFGDNRFELLRNPGIPISNWIEEPIYHNENTGLRSGDNLFFYTDGIIEIRNNAGEQFGEERLLDILLNDSSEPSGVLNRIIDSACEFAEISGSSELPDDITMALVKMR